MYLTIEVAYYLSIEKWKYIVNSGGSDANISESISELTRFDDKCSYCEFFADSNTDCEGCPLQISTVKIKSLGCMRGNHPYRRWAHHKSKENAQAVLNLIISTKPF